MEETKNKNGNMQNRKKLQVVKGGGGGIGVVLLWGGVFAVATFVVTLINKRNKRRLNFPTDDKKKSNRTDCDVGEEEERNQGLRSLLQSQIPISDPHICCPGISIGNNVIKMGSSQEDELRTVATCGDLKIVNNFNDLVKDRVVTVDIEGDSLSEMEMCKSGQDNSNKEDCFEDSISVEAVQEVGGAVELPVTARNVRCQDGNLKMLLEDSAEDEDDNDEEEYEDEELEEEDEDDIYDDDESIEGKGDEDSEGTGESSRESNAEAIWPAELIEEHQHLELKKRNDQTKEENIDEEGTKKLEVAWKGNADILQQDHAGEKETGCMMMGNCASLILISKSRLRTWSSLTVGLLILAVVHHLLVSSFLNLNISL
ncbi:uncharacterized protein LOC113348875 isoform X2 [Papaver somniferum]|uniref:uncharacterized protein LOC113348875 isoform X2 n=1 Tax=Papaver somniferum TaxID=3469 RepID=UPI000E6FEEE5|nr:uncharacterized protein LOC113348875 isoform X2 [Papaver somniferum]